jgi:hypothetical protein
VNQDDELTSKTHRKINRENFILATYTILEVFSVSWKLTKKEVE